MPTDAELLHRYVEQRNERAFAELVQRHVGLVYAAALRRTGGRTHLAEEISQKVFSDLARKAAALSRHPALTGWLYRSTRYAAIDAVRAEVRRQKLVQSLSVMPETPSPAESQVDWERLRPVIDEAMDQLKERDREVVLLRFINGLSFADVGGRLHLTENAARMRAERALDKLRVHLESRGLTSTTAAVGLLLANPMFAAAPAGLASTVTAAALTAAPAGGAAGILSFLLMSKVTAPVLSAAIAAGLTAVLWKSFAPSVSAEELTALRQENARLTEAATVAGANPASIAVADDHGAQAAALVRAIDQKRSRLDSASASSSTAAAAAPAAQPADEEGRHRNRGQATPHDAFMTMAWADDAADVGARAKTLWFDPRVREKALAVHASMPDALRTQYPTPEELYAFLFAADALVAPPPGADLLERFEVVELGPGRAAVHPPGHPKNPYEFQLTPAGWKWVVPEAGVTHAPKVLNNETLAKLGAP